MNIHFRALAGLTVTTLSVCAYANDSTASAPAKNGDSYTAMAKTMGDKKADAKAQENNRLGKCGSMNGGEKKTCEANAKAQMAGDTSKGNAHDGAMATTPKTAPAATTK